MPETKITYTREELRCALLRLLNNNEAYIESAGIPTACTGAAEICFITQKSEDADTALLRQALKDLHTYEGHFNYK